MSEKFFSKCAAFIGLVLIFGPALLVCILVTANLIANLLCVNERLPWITYDAVIWLNMLQFPVACIVCPFIILICLINVFWKKHRRIYLLAIGVNILSLAYCFIGDALPSWRIGKVFATGNDRIEFNDQSEGMDLDSRFTQIDGASSMEWDGGWLAYRCSYVNKASIYEWLKDNGLKEGSLKDTQSDNWQWGSFSEKQPVWWPKDMGAEKIFVKHMKENIGNNLTKNITVWALMDDRSNTLYVRINRAEPD